MDDGAAITGQDGQQGAAWHYDGRSATRHAVRVAPTGEGFTLSGDGVFSGPHRWSDIAALDGTRGRSVYGLNGLAGWRLIFEGPPPEAFAVHLPLPARYGRWVDRFGLTRAAIGFTAIAAGFVALVLSAPSWIAPFVPRSVENRLGDAMIGDFGGRFCRTAAGRTALDRLATHLGAEAAGVRSVEVANIPMVNAVAMPGGRIMIFDGLLKQAKSADEVAGVLAHEIGHVRHRDTMAALIRQLGLSMVLGGLDGNVGALVSGALSLSYGRDAERAADVYAIDALRTAAISPDPIAAFFDRLGGGKGGEKLERATGWISSHPVSADRKAAFQNSKQRGKTYGPALSDADWAAIRGMCRADPKGAKASGFSW
ncbi:M48 family metallopeptidase [Sphingobium sufflavum]|uniref:M48 family metallopeptidase n=1 Tax=Sphingobium sufflavum TaxID=1129547 RepID=UPI001F3842F9|nr:M48 family metallopeptidase [Sphingobium sufflavum]MCE7794980.1 M48 family metallopeptidase [Sphingobium sufflavum]